MSSAHTHALIGVVGGLTLVRAQILPLPPLLTIGASMLLALWPDIDEPYSWIGRRAQWLITTTSAIVLAMIGALYQPRFLPTALPARIEIVLASLSGIATGLTLGICVLGPLFAVLVLRSFQWTVGGHRSGTHSLITSALLLFSSYTLFTLLPPAAPLGLIMAALWWGQLLHLIGDVVTPQGVGLFWPLSSRRFGLLPRSLRPWGESLVGVGSVLVGIALLVQ